MTADTVIGMGRSMIEMAPHEKLGDVLSYLLGLSDTDAKVVVHTVIGTAQKLAEKSAERDENVSDVTYAAMVGLIFGMAAESCQMSPKRAAA